MMAQGTLRTYVSGFVLSVGLTVIVYAFVQAHLAHHSFSADKVIGGILALAVVQLLVQLIFFLHLGRESRPRWNLAVLLFAFMIIGIIVGGSLWIMSNLNANMSPAQINKYMSNQDSL
jgi:cytochrome o ubiquinol oxidase operon protein cyoD